MIHIIVDVKNMIALFTWYLHWTDCFIISFVNLLIYVINKIVILYQKWGSRIKVLYKRNKRGNHIKILNGKWKITKVTKSHHWWTQNGFEFFRSSSFFLKETFLFIALEDDRILEIFRQGDCWKCFATWQALFLIYNKWFIFDLYIWFQFWSIALKLQLCLVGFFYLWK